MKMINFKEWITKASLFCLAVACLMMTAPSAFSQDDFFDISAGYFQYEGISESGLEPGMAIKGKFRDGVQWKDESGLNTVVLSYDVFPDQGKRDIYVYQFRKVGGKVSLVWDIQDFGTAQCKMTFVDHSLQILDLDFDGTMEIGFMYVNACEGPDAQVTKLMLLKDGKKLAIRGKFTIEDHVETEKIIDPVVAQYPAIFKNFMLKQWKEYKAGVLEYANYSLDKANGFLHLQREYLDASGGTTDELFDLNGLPMRTAPEMEKKIREADVVEITPDRSGVLVGNITGLSYYNPVEKLEQILVTFLENTAAISILAWSPDKSKVAFTTLNFEEYPKASRIFVLTLANNSVVKKQRFDVPIMYMAAGDWVVEAPKFLDNHTLEYEERTMVDEHQEPGKSLQIDLD